MAHAPCSCHQASLVLSRQQNQSSERYKDPLHVGGSVHLMDTHYTACRIRGLVGLSWSIARRAADLSMMAKEVLAVLHHLSGLDWRTTT